QKARRSTSADRPFALVPSIERFGRHHRPVRGHAPLGRAAPHGTASSGHGCGRPRLSNKISRIGVRAASTFLFVSNTVLLHLLGLLGEDRKSTRLNSSHVSISYAVFCLKKKKQKTYYVNIRHKSHTQI